MTLRRTRIQKATSAKVESNRTIAGVSVPKEKLEYLEEKKSGPSMYKVTMKANNQTKEYETDSLLEAIDALKPRVIKTRITFHIDRADGKSCDKILFVLPARAIFNNRRRASYFVNNLIFKSNVRV